MSTLHMLGKAIRLLLDPVREGVPHVSTLRHGMPRTSTLKSLLSSIGPVEDTGISPHVRYPNGGGFGYSRPVAASGFARPASPPSRRTIR